MKGSPEREDQKKKVINLDIAELKDKIENSVSHRSFGNKNIAGVKWSNSQERNREISIGKIKPYVNEKEDEKVTARPILKQQEAKKR